MWPNCILYFLRRWLNFTGEKTKMKQTRYSTKIIVINHLSKWMPIGQLQYFILISPQLMLRVSRNHTGFMILRFSTRTKWIWLNDPPPSFYATAEPYRHQVPKILFKTFSTPLRHKYSRCFCTSDFVSELSQTSYTWHQDIMKDHLDFQG